MGHIRFRRWFKHVGFSLLVFSFAVCGANAMARAPDSFAAVPEPHAWTLACHPVCGNTAIEACLAPVRTRHASHLVAPRPGTAPPEVAVSTGESAAFVELPIALRLQRNLFSGGGRLAPLDVLPTATDKVRPSERTARAPDWAMQLHAARKDNEFAEEKVGG